VAPILLAQLDASDPPGRLAAWLRAAGAEVDVRALDAGDALPDGFADHAGFVVMGGPMGAADDDVAPFLPQVRTLLREAVSSEVPTLGVCLGAQLLALANGGRVERNPDGPEIGAQLIAKRAAAATDPLFGPLPITPDVIQWHFDAVTALPPGAVQLASSPGCALQAFRLGRLAWGIQFHIETTPAVVREWAEADGGALAGYDLDTIVRRAEAVHDDLAEVWAPFAAAFAAAVRAPAAVPPSPGRNIAAGPAPVTDPAAIRAALAAEASAARDVLGMPAMRERSGPPAG
jgi:GMP synthase (glutamine-hydrolysing)